MALVVRNGRRVWDGVNDNAGPNGAVVNQEQYNSVYGTSDAASSRYGYTDSGIGFLKGNDDSTLNAVNQQALWDREDVLRGLAEHREDYAMDRLVAAAKRNGINPIFLLDALSSNTVGSAASYSTSAAKANNYDSNARTDNANSASVVGAFIAALGIILAHML